MVESKHTAPHVTLMDEFDVTELIELRKWGKSVAQERNIKLTYLPFFIKAVVAALREFPTLNASIDDENQEIVIKHYYHIGLATATDNGLMVPVIRDADRKSMFDLAKEIADKATRAREMKLEPSELKGSTFTISSLGGFGGEFFTPIINYPEVAILGIGAIKEKPVVYNGEIAVRSMLHVSLSFDHRLIDGDVAARFIGRLKQVLESPKLLMMEM
jgi:pyruvate dehydrogenase E2 component (dihydrolipoamide acetyltransferase)